MAGLRLLWISKVVGISSQHHRAIIHLAGVDLIPGGFYFIRSRFKRRRDPYQGTPVYKVLHQFSHQETSIISGWTNSFLCRSAMSITRRMRLTTCMRSKPFQVTIDNGWWFWKNMQDCDYSAKVIQRRVIFTIFIKVFVQVMERNISMKMTAHGQVFVLLSPLLVQM